MRTLNSKHDLIQRTVESLCSNLPTGVEVTVSGGSLGVATGDQMFVFKLDVRQAISAAAQARLGLGVDLPASAEVLLVTRYLPKPLRSKLREFGVNFVDAAGNINIHVTAPLIVVSVEAKGADPARPAGRPVLSLKGVPASKVTRVLLDYETPLDVADVIRLSGASRASAYRALDYLQEIGIIERSWRGLVTSCDWAKLLDLWSDSYGVLSSNRIRSFIAPRGLDEVMSKLKSVQELDYALTGTLAAANYEAYAAGYTAIVYTPQIDELAKRLGIRESSTGGNVLLIEPNSDFQLQNTTMFDGVRVAAVSQIAVDLLTGPGRNPEEGKALVRYMKERNDWRIELRHRGSQSAA